MCRCSEGRSFLVCRSQKQATAEYQDHHAVIYTHTSTHLHSHLLCASVSIASIPHNQHITSEIIQDGVCEQTLIDIIN
jgi:hypothetical protein